MTRPSWQDYGTYDESEHARLWDGVVGAWCPSLGPTGSRLHDHSRFGNWGTLQNMDNATDWVLSNGQYALDFDNTNDHVTTDRGVAITSTIVTVQAWVRRAATISATNAFPRVIDIGDGTHTLQVVSDIGTTGGSGFIATKHSQFQSAISATQWGFAPSLGVWEHIVVVANSIASTTRLFRNGVEQTGSNNNNVGAGVSANSVYIGSRRDLNSVTFWSGMLDNITIWQRALTPNEVRDLYLLGRGGMYKRRRRSRRRAIEQAVSGVRRRRLLTGMV